MTQTPSATHHCELDANAASAGMSIAPTYPSRRSWRSRRCRRPFPEAQGSGRRKSTADAAQDHRGLEPALPRWGIKEATERRYSCANVLHRLGGRVDVAIRADDEPLDAQLRRSIGEEGSLLHQDALSPSIQRDQKNPRLEAREPALDLG